MARPATAQEEEQQAAAEEMDGLQGHDPALERYARLLASLALGGAAVRNDDLKALRLGWSEIGELWSGDGFSTPLSTAASQQPVQLASRQAKPAKQRPAKASQTHSEAGHRPASPTNSPNGAQQRRCYSTYCKGSSSMSMH